MASVKMAEQNRKPDNYNAITEGVIWKQLLLFFFPLLLGTFFQTLYNTVDAVIVGRFVGTEGLSAVGGAAATLINLFVGFFVGVSSGATVVIAQYYGAKRAGDVERAVHTAMALALAGGVILTLICFFLGPEALVWMNTPEDTLADSGLYLRIFALGMIPNMIYNMGSGVLRAAGDSRHPTVYLIAGALTNTVLDLLFVAVFHQGVAGAAIATILSQLVSAVLTVIRLCRTEDVYRLNLRRIRFDRVYLAKIVGIGIPAGLRSSMYTFSNIVIQAAVNGFGTTTVAAWAVWGKLDSVYWLLLSSLGTALTTFVGQNYGAGKSARVRRSVKETAVISLLFTAFFTVFIWILAEPLYGIFIPDAQVIKEGAHMSRCLAPYYWTYITIEVLSAALIGMGDALIPTVITVLGVCVLRIIWNVTAVPYFHTIETVIWNYPITWSVTSTAFLIYYRIFKKKRHLA